MLTSHSAPIQVFPVTLPWFNVSVEGAPSPRVKPAVSSKFQLGSPTIPFLPVAKGEYGEEPP